MQDFSGLPNGRADAGLDVVIVGGDAGVTHGSAGVTRDLEIGAARTGEDVEKLRRILAGWHPRHRMTPRRLSFLEHPPGEPR